jgi:tRNA pseudouridine38-40 synthase
LRNIRLTLSYDGTDFHGWQIQPHVPTIQGLVGEAVARLTGERVSLYGSGRTDAGVHALKQIANFQTGCAIPAPNLAAALNHLLPAAIRVRSAAEVDGKFHARYSATAKTYHYRLLLAPFCSPFLARWVWHTPFPLDCGEMQRAAGHFAGSHDFTSFAAAESGAEDNIDSLGGSSVRTVYSSRLIWRRRRQMLIYAVRGNGFLHHMVRNMVGTLVEIGKGRMRGEDIPAMLAARDRRRAGPTAPAAGLCLVSVEYDSGV